MFGVLLAGGVGTIAKRAGNSREARTRVLRRSANLENFIHPEINRPVEFFCGSYTVSEEGKIPYQGKEVLYFVGIAGLEASCCGRSGGAFAKVPGFLLRWKTGKDESGFAVSKVDRIRDEKSQREISRRLKERYPHLTQIEFL